MSKGLGWKVVPDPLQESLQVTLNQSRDTRFRNWGIGIGQRNKRGPSRRMHSGFEHDAGNNTLPMVHLAGLAVATAVHEVEFNAVNYLLTSLRMKTLHKRFLIQALS